VVDVDGARRAATVHDGADVSDYLGVTVLDATEPDRAGGTEDEHDRRIFELNSQTGILDVHVPGPANIVVRNFEWVCFTRAEAKTMRTFIADRYGRAVPFWLRTWERDLELTLPYIANDPAIFVREVGYRTLAFPLGPYRRHLSIRADSGVFYHRKITAAEVQDATTDRLALDSPIPAAIAVPGFVNFLRYSRLDADEPRIRWDGGQFARCSLPVRELPKETPP
jgi:hypothetical protein